MFFLPFNGLENTWKTCSKRNRFYFRYLSLRWVIITFPVKKKKLTISETQNLSYSRMQCVCWGWYDPFNWLKYYLNKPLPYFFNFQKVETTGLFLVFCRGVKGAAKQSWSSFLTKFWISKDRVIAWHFVITILYPCETSFSTVSVINNSYHLKINIKDEMQLLLF